MTTRADVLRDQSRRLEVCVRYGDRDVEAAAEQLGVPISDAEVEAILARVDDELGDLAGPAVSGAVASRIDAALLGLSRSHLSGDDD